MEHVQILLLGPAARKKGKIQYKFGRCLDLARIRKEKPIFQIFHINPSFYFQARYIPALKTASKEEEEGRRSNEKS